MSGNCFQSISFLSPPPAFRKRFHVYTQKTLSGNIRKEFLINVSFLSFDSTGNEAVLNTLA